MRDAIMTGIALILLTIAISLTLIYAMKYARGEGWLEPRRQGSIYMDSGDDASPENIQ